MKMKYIIELEDVPFVKKDGAFLYRVKGFNSLVFDLTGLNKLTPFDKRAIEHDAYENGKKNGYLDGFKAAEQAAYQRGYENGFAEGRKRAELSDAFNTDNKKYTEAKQVIKDFLCGKSHDIIECLNSLEIAKELLGDGCTITDIDRWLNESK